MNLLRKLVITGLGTGYLPVAPGTWGSALVAAAGGLLIYATGGSPTAVYASMAAVLAVSAVGCVALGRWCQAHFGRKDPSACVIDEFAGQALTFLALPLSAANVRANWIDALVVAGVAFFFFRVADILKPPPARRLEKLPLGWGVLADDLAAAVYANLAAQISLRLCYFQTISF
jgi:phosphatidylglycerophosphatase A